MSFAGDIVPATGIHDMTAVLPLSTMMAGRVCRLLGKILLSLRTGPNKGARADLHVDICCSNINLLKGVRVFAARSSAGHA